MTRLRAIFALFLALYAPASALDIRSSVTAGTAPPALTNGEIAINRADKRLIFKNVDGSLDYGSLLNALASGRKAVEQGDGSDLTINLGLTGSVARPFSARFRDRLSVKDFGAKGDGVTDDSAAVTNAFNACYALGGGEVYFPPTGADYRLVTGQSFSGNTCGAAGVGVPNWPGPVGSKAQWTQFGSWISCEDTTKPCLQFNGSGFVRGLNFWNNQPTPSATPGTAYTPLDLPYTVVFKQNFSHIERVQFANVSRGFAFDYPTSANIAGTYSSARDVWGAGLRVTARFAGINDTMTCDTLRARIMWQVSNSNVIDWMNANAIGWDIQYWDNPTCINVEFYKQKIALKFTDGTAVYGTTTITRAATNFQFINFGFNQVVQAVDLATGVTAVSGQFANVLAQHDTDTNRAASFFFNFASDNVDVAIHGIEFGFIGNSIFALGGGNEGRLRVTGMHVGANLPNFSGSGYGTIGGAGSHAFVLNKNSKLDLPDGTQAIQPGLGAGTVISCGNPTGTAGSNCGQILTLTPAVTPTAP